MKNYQNGKIYIITGSETDKIYLGSTINTLNRRLSRHTTGEECSSSIIINNNKEYNIVLLETYPCNSKEELLWRERYWFDEFRSIIVNKKRPIASKEEIRDENRVRAYEYHWNNKEKISKEHSLYYKKNSNRIKTTTKRNRDLYKQDPKWIEQKNEKERKRKVWLRSWCGDKNHNNNLLSISITLFD